MSVNTDQLIVCKCEICGEKFKIKLSTYYQRKRKGYKPGKFCERCRSPKRSRIKVNPENCRYSYKWGE